MSVHEFIDFETVSFPQICSSDTIIGLVKINVHISRVFSIGIGSTPSHHLLESIAKSGNGTCAYIENDSSVQKQTLNQLKNSLQPSLTGT